MIHPIAKRMLRTRIHESTNRLDDGGSWKWILYLLLVQHRFLVAWMTIWGAMTPLAEADLVLEISDATVAPGGSGSFDVTVKVEASDEPTKLLAWDTEILVEPSDTWIRLVSVQQDEKSTVLNDVMDFRAKITANVLQANGFASGPDVALLEPAAGPLVLYRVNFDVSRGATPGSSVLVNFSPRQFTNFVDDKAQPIELSRQGGVIAITAIPEPPGWALLCLMGVLAVSNVKQLARGTILGG